MNLHLLFSFWHAIIVCIKMIVEHTIVVESSVIATTEGVSSK